jgi:hypothetical protein
MWKEDKKGRGYKISRLASHGKMIVNLGFDNQTLFCLVLGF